MRHYLMVFICILALTCLGQENACSNAISFRASVAKTDYFTGFEWMHSRSNQFVLGQFDFGYSRTILQGCFYPRVGIGYGLKLIDFKAFHLAPIATTSLSSLSTISSNKRPDYWSETYAGYRLVFGKKWACVQSTTCGLFHEMTYNTISGKYFGVSSFGFYASIGIQYAW
jgi:hypothetical protein